MRPNVRLKMYFNSRYEEFWRSEEKFYTSFEGAIFCSDRNDTSLLPFALLRNTSDIEQLSFALQYWESCCRLAQTLDLTYISMRIANTLSFDKPENELTSDDWEERISTLTGAPHSTPKNGHFYSTTTKLWIKLSDGALGPKYGEQTVGADRDR